jgi:cellulose synthase/poly-beta-1,6-N-acetylglucosamine synthase-like glycosyltransferase
MDLLDFIFYVIIFIALLSIALYIPRLIGWFGSMKPQKRLVNPKKNNIAVIIPARNESKVIGDLLDSLKSQTYDKNFFDVHIIVKDSFDKTIDMASQYGYNIHIAPEQKCKGQALDHCLKDILKTDPNKYASYLIIDADCTLDKYYIEEMNNALLSGAQVYNSKKIVKNYSLDKGANSLSSSCNGLIWPLIDNLGNRFKSDHNITIMPIGTGLMLTSDLITKFNGWPYNETLTEDMELMNDCVVNNYKTYYTSYAKIYLEESTSLSVTNKRRKRWLSGLIHSERLYRKRVNEASKNSFSQKINSYYVHALDYVFVMIGSLSFGSIFFMLAFLCSIHSFNYSLLNYSLICLLSIYILFLIMTMACMITDRKNIKLSFLGKLKLLFIHPLFYMGYIPIITKILITKKDENWEVIERIDYSLNGKGAK